jgi:hypothetical protein
LIVLIIYLEKVVWKRTTFFNPNHRLVSFIVSKKNEITTICLEHLNHANTLATFFEYNQRMTRTIIQPINGPIPVIRFMQANPRDHAQN